MKEFTPATDIYSLAATLYYVLSGTVPPQAPDLVEEELPFPPSIPRRLVAPIRKAMSNARKSRHATMTDFISELSDGTQPSQPKPEPKLSGFISGHEYVDLGLPSGLKWATCNVGASSPSDYGDYYAWGGTSTKSEYTPDSNSKTFGKRMDISGNPSYDAARAKWGGSWRLPTIAEFDELLDQCSWTWTSQGGHNGYLVKGPNGKSIFLPAAGWRNGSSLGYAGERGYYWSSTPIEDYSNRAYSLGFNSGGRSTGWGYRSFGPTVRAVSE